MPSPRPSAPGDSLDKCQARGSFLLPSPRGRDGQARRQDPESGSKAGRSQPAGIGLRAGQAPGARPPAGRGKRRRLGRSSKPRRKRSERRRSRQRGRAQARAEGRRPTHRRASEQRHEETDRQEWQPRPEKDADWTEITSFRRAVRTALRARKLGIFEKLPSSRIQIPRRSRPHWAALRTTRSSHWLVRRPFRRLIG